YNDFGTMVCLVSLFAGLLWAAGVRLRVFAGLGAVALAAFALLITLPGFKYRVDRLTSFADAKHCDPQQACYQSLHGLYAIADGGWFGVGLGESRLKWGWLPNGHNDFIFAVIADELGVVGCFVVLALLSVLAYTGLRIARRVDDPFRRLVSAGITIWLVGQAAINIGGVVGLLPITGLPLPFISDGGSALVVTLAAVGLLASFARAEPDASRALHGRPPDRWVRLLWAPLPPLPRTRRKAERTTAGRRVWRAARATRAVLDEVAAQVVVGFGGYVAVPAYLAAWRRHTPIVIHEVNVPPGVANRMGMRFTRHVAVGFPYQTEQVPALRQARVTGVPLRQSIATLDRSARRAQARAHFGLDPDRPTLFVFGASQGARSINLAMAGAAKALTAAGIQVL